MVWSSLGLKIVRNNGKAPLMLANLSNRNEAFNSDPCGFGEW